MTRPTVRQSAFALVLGVVVSFFSSAVWAQAQLAAPTIQPVVQVPDATKAAPAIAQVLEQGKELESQRRWAEAYALYDDTNRLNPGQTEVESRLDVAKMHFDIGRRYADSSFRRTVSSLSDTDALELYTDAANKLQSHYVQVPDWADLVNRGTADLEIALNDQTFRRNEHWPSESRPRQFVSA